MKKIKTKQGGSQWGEISQPLRSKRVLKGAQAHRAHYPSNRQTGVTTLGSLYQARRT